MEGFAILEAASLRDIAVAAGAGFLVSYGAVLVSGFLPISAAVFPAPEPLARTLVLADMVALVLLAILLTGYIALGTAWAPGLIAAGLAVLAAPPVFQALPQRWAGGLAGLALLLVASGALAAVIAGRLFIWPAAS